MDPDATWAIILDDSLDTRDRIDATEDLHRWIARGGFLPSDATESPEHFLAGLRQTRIALIEMLQGEEVK
jgi:hypothetical protein